MRGPENPIVICSRICCKTKRNRCGGCDDNGYVCVNSTWIELHADLRLTVKDTDARFGGGIRINHVGARKDAP